MLTGETSARGVVRGVEQHRYYPGKYGGRGYPRGPLGTEEEGRAGTAIGFCPLCGENARGTTNVRGVFECPECKRVWYDSRVGRQQRSFSDYFSHS